MPVTIRFDPNVNSKQAQVIPDATLNNDGVMTRQQVAALASQGEIATKAFVNTGIIPTASLGILAAAVDGNTFSIAGQVFRFVNTLGAADTTIQIKVSGSMAQTISDAVDAVNGATNVNVVQSVPPFTLAVRATVDPFNLILQTADVRGGTVTPAFPPNAALLTTLAGGGIWTIANLNEATGSPAQMMDSAEGFIEITAAMVAFGAVYVMFPFTINNFIMSAFTVVFLDPQFVILAPKYTDESPAIVNFPENHNINITLGFGATPLVVGDRVYFRVS